jgi:maltose alpha-D-glucosyltransferase/alpha-amylase
VHPWYRTAVFYEVMIRGFRDSDADGIGDLRGLIERLDHFEFLGVDCLWLLPFYESPLRDGGYDISDFLTVHPQFGDDADVTELIDEAHRRGIRIIADLVVNHTSDQHPWFVESRSSKNNPRADYYVWGDDPTRFSEARIIFIDHEESNWTWDPVRSQFYWHRFFSHQPDLNYDCPEVSEEMFGVMSFWLERGLDGLRLDAVPYLFERDGTNCENLPETHAWLRDLRRRVDAAFPDRVLLAEANQPPEQVVEYFGQGDECHMAFHFPLMPRLFKAVREHKAATVIDAWRATPEIPEGCQWGIFLRNHDELTLEMVTPEEYEFMLRHYAPDEERMRRNVGIGRRLFPLLDDDRRQAELLHALLLSLPGSPFLYYGDEIGMGEDLSLSDRDPVRTPMQWDATANAGFSEAETLYLPVIRDGPYGFPVRNVAAQREDAGSFLIWLRDLLAVRRRIGTMGTAPIEFVDHPDPAILIYRRGEVCVVANLADDERDASGSVTGDQPEILAGTDPSRWPVLPPYGWVWLAC